MTTIDLDNLYFAVIDSKINFLEIRQPYKVWEYKTEVIYSVTQPLLDIKDTLYQDEKDNLYVKYRLISYDELLANLGEHPYGLTYKQINEILVKVKDIETILDTKLLIDRYDRVDTLWHIYNPDKEPLKKGISLIGYNTYCLTPLKEKDTTEYLTNNILMLESHFKNHTLYEYIHIEKEKEIEESVEPTPTLLQRIQNVFKRR